MKSCPSPQDVFLSTSFMAKQVWPPSRQREHSARLPGDLRFKTSCYQYPPVISSDMAAAFVEMIRKVWKGNCQHS